MRILIAPDKFKCSLAAPAAASAIAAGIRAVDPSIEIDVCPLADGGEGTVEALVSSTGGTLITRRVTGPLPDMRVDATFGIFGVGATLMSRSSPPPMRLGDARVAPTEKQEQIAVIEMSAASGLHLLRDRDRNPGNATTYGAGQLLLEAARLNASRIILGIGGSATIDAGVGCCQACGLPVILDGIGPADVHEPLVGADLERVVLIKHARGSPLDRIPIEVASDVTNPLYGPIGAARVFGPQKGATPEQVEQFDAWHRRLAQRCNADEFANRPGAGAAGGLGFAMMAFFGATLRPGFEIVAEAVGFHRRLAQADLVITGEGCLDASSLHGKVSVAVAALCRARGIPCLVLAGLIDPGVDWRERFAMTGSLMELANDLAIAKARAPELLGTLAGQKLRSLLNGEI